MSIYDMLFTHDSVWFEQSVVTLVFDLLKKVKKLMYCSCLSGLRDKQEVRWSCFKTAGRH
jgi:hypothetical protein